MFSSEVNCLLCKVMYSPPEAMADNILRVPYSAYISWVLIFTNFMNFANLEAFMKGRS